MEVDLELSLLHPAQEQEQPSGFFLCTYCGRKFYRSQALGGHQNAHKYERILAKRRLEIAAAMRAHGASAAGSRVDAAAACRPGGAGGAEASRMDVQQSTRIPSLLLGKSNSSEYGVEHADELDLSLRL